MRLNNLLLIVIAGLIFTVTGCDDPGSSGENQAPANKDSVRELRFISAAKHHFLDPQKMSWSHDIRVIQALFEPLTRLQIPSLEIEPGAAKSWTISDDQLTYTFKLHENSKWSNGDPVTAHDFIYAWRRATLPDMAADYSQLMFCIEGAEEFFNWRSNQIKQYAQQKNQGQSPDPAALWDLAAKRFTETVGVKAVDDYTLVVKLKEPTPYLIELLAFATFMPVHPQSVEAMVSISPETGMLVQDPKWTRPENLITNGPYYVKQWRQGRDLLMVANEHFRDRAKMKNDQVLEIIIENTQTALLKYNRGEVDWLPDMPVADSMVADLLSQDRNDVHVVPAAGTYFYNYNCLPKLPDGSDNPLADYRVRLALSLCIDRQTIVDRVTRLGDKQPIAKTFVPLGALSDYDPPVEAGAGFDPPRAIKLLNEAGYNPDNLLSVSILYNTGSGHELVAQQIKHVWDTHLPVSVQLDGVETKQFSERLKRHNFMISRAAWYGDYRDATTFLDKLMSDNGNNDGAWANKEYDRLMLEARRELDRGKRAAILRQAEMLMVQRQPIAPIYQYVNIELYDPEKIKGGITLNTWKRRRLEYTQVTR